MSESWSTKKTRQPPPYDPFQPVSAFPKVDSGLMHLAAERGRISANVDNLSRRVESVADIVLHGNTHAPSLVVQVAEMRKDIQQLKIDVESLTESNNTNFTALNATLIQQFAALGATVRDIQYKQDHGQSVQDKANNKHKWEFGIKLFGFLGAMATMAGILLKIVAG